MANQRQISWSSADPLGEALHFLRLSGTFYCRSELTAPWGLTMPPMPGCLWFHAIVAGRCMLDVDEPAARRKGKRESRRTSVELTAGDFALVPHGRGHRVLTEPNVAAPDVTELPDERISERYSLLRHGGGGARTTLICGVVRFDHPSAQELVAMLPPLIHLGAGEVLQSDWLDTILRLMGAEARELRPGGETIITRLADVLVIHAIRAWLERDEGARQGWLGALRDRQLGRVLVAVQRDPARAWSVESLAGEAAMSRSAFAARFVELVGEPPMHYVARVRMRLAASLLREENVTLAALAGRLGYRSEAAFSRAFKRFIGESPGAVRRAAA